MDNFYSISIILKKLIIDISKSYLYEMNDMNCERSEKHEENHTYNTHTHTHIMRRYVCECVYLLCFCFPFGPIRSVHQMWESKNQG